MTTFCMEEDWGQAYPEFLQRNQQADSSQKLKPYEDYTFRLLVGFLQSFDGLDIMTMSYELISAQQTVLNQKTKEIRAEEYGFLVIELVRSLPIIKKERMFIAFLVFKMTKRFGRSAKNIYDRKLKELVKLGKSQLINSIRFKSNIKFTQGDKKEMKPARQRIGINDKRSLERTRDALISFPEKIQLHVYHHYIEKDQRDEKHFQHQTQQNRRENDSNQHNHKGYRDRRSSGQVNTPPNDIQNINGLRSSGQVNTPPNDIQNINGLRSSGQVNTPPNDIQNINGLRSSGQVNTPPNDIQNINGLRSSGQVNTPPNDIQNINGLRSSGQVNTPPNDIQNINGLRTSGQVNTTPNDIQNINGLRASRNHRSAFNAGSDNTFQDESQVSQPLSLPALGSRFTFGVQRLSSVLNHQQTWKQMNFDTLLQQLSIQNYDVNKLKCVLFNVSLEFLFEKMSKKGINLTPYLNALLRGIDKLLKRPRGR